MSRLTRTKGLRLALLGSVGALLLGSGLISAVADTAASTGNQVDSTAYDEEHDIKLAIVDNDTACDDPSVTPEDHVAAAMFLSPVDLDDTGISGQHLDNYCVFNTGSFAADVYVNFANVLDTDLGCSGLEADDDESCEEGAAGELSGAITSVSVRTWGTQGGACASFTHGGTFRDLETTPVLVASLAPGEFCEFWFRLDVDQDPALRRIAQTDRVQWDIVFTGQDQAA